MSEEKENQLSSKEQLFNVELSRAGLNETAETISSICNRDLGTNLTKTRLKDERRHWEAEMWLAGIIFDNPVQSPEGKDTKPSQYTIDVTTDNSTKTLNARMVGQTLQKLFAFAEVWRHHGSTENPTERDNLLINKAHTVTLRHFEEVVDKFELSQDKDSDGISVKKALDQYGLSSSAGIDKVNPKDLLLIINALRNRATNIDEKERNKINKSLGISGVILHRKKDGEVHFDEKITKSRHLTSHED